VWTCRSDLQQANVVLRYFLAEKVFHKIVIFEQRKNVGGIWYYTPEINLDEGFKVPQNDPTGYLEKPIWRIQQPQNIADDRNGVNGIERNKEPIFPSPIYERLETNIPHSLMKYSDLSFPDTAQLFPRHETVQHYLEEYAKDILHLVQFNTQVVSVNLVDPNVDRGKEKWHVTTKDICTSETCSKVFDAVVGANGHYNTIYIPDIPGLKEWNEIHTSSISHSKYYRTPESFTGKVSTSSSLRTSQQTHFLQIWILSKDVTESHRYRQLGLWIRHKYPAHPDSHAPSSSVTEINFPALLLRFHYQL
jgi:cation diffusion facilitator CzcD-associated flavoprotein CzcO